jgi:hypothetical protein
MLRLTLGTGSMSGLPKDMAGRFMGLDQLLNIILTRHKPEVPQNESQNCEGAWPRRAADAVRHRRRGDRVKRRSQNQQWDPIGNRLAAVQIVCR